MRVLIVGANGLIGSALVERLRHRHRLLLGVRDTAAWHNGIDAGRAGADVVHIDLSAAAPELWREALSGVNAVINAAGIFREQDTQRFDAIHVKGPKALFDAAMRAGVKRIVQISALGAHVRAPAAFLATKAQADAYLARLPLRSTVVQPSLVFAPEGRSTRWFALLAALPLTPVPGTGAQLLQPVHLDDVCEAIERLLDLPDPPERIAAVGPAPLSLRTYLAMFKQALGVGGPFLQVPLPLARLASRVAACLAHAPVDADALRMLEQGNVADPRGLACLLGRAARPPASFIDARAHAVLRLRALLGWTVPLLRWATAALWVVTGLVSAFAFPEQDSLALLARTGLHGAAALAALYGAAALDIALGLALLLPPRARRWAYRLQIASILGYTAIITACLPEYWAHPYGPVSKNLPLLAATVLLHALDTGHFPRPGPGSTSKAGR